MTAPWHCARRGAWVLCLGLSQILAVGVAGAGTDCGQGTPSANSEVPWSATLTVENDLFANTDRHYTNGIKLAWTSPDLTAYTQPGALPDWTRPVIDRLPLIHAPCLQRKVGITLGQEIFTPEDIGRPIPNPADRPYAAWLYLGTALHNQNPGFLDTAEIQLGVVGPAALGREAQNGVHRLRGFSEAKGWDKQLANEPGLVLLVERKARVWRRVSGGGLGADLIPHVGIALGNVRTYASTGAEARVGWHLPLDFGTSLIRPGGDSNSPTETNGSSRPGFYVTAGFSGRAVARDIFLDGNSFRHGPGVSKRHAVGDAFVGASLVWGHFKLTYAQVFRSKEFHGQKGHGEFGSVSLSYHP